MKTEIKDKIRSRLIISFISVMTISFMTGNIIPGFTAEGRDIQISPKFLSVGNDIDDIGENIRDRIESRIDNIQSESNQIVTSIGTPQSYSGKIERAQMNSDNGQVERIFFGDWHLNVESTSNTNFTASFTMRDLVKNTTPFKFNIDNMKVNSIQRNNEDVKYGGISDISRQSIDDGKTSVLKNIPTTITIIENKMIVITFENSDFPITGIVTSN